MSEAENIKVYSPHDALKVLLYQTANTINTGAQNKLYRRKLFDKIRFPFGLYYEDLATTYRIFFECRQIALTQEKMYLYRVSQNSILRQSFSPKMLSCIQVSRQLYQDISAKFPDLEKAAASRAFSVNRAIFLQLPHDKKDERKQVWQEMKKYRRTVIFDSQARKRERLAALLSYSGSKIFHLFAFLYRRWQMRT